MGYIQYIKLIIIGKIIGAYIHKNEGLDYFVHSEINIGGSFLPKNVILI